MSDLQNCTFKYLPATELGNVSKGVRVINCCGNYNQLASSLSLLLLVVIYILSYFPRSRLALFLISVLTPIVWLLFGISPVCLLTDDFTNTEASTQIFLHYWDVLFAVLFLLPLLVVLARLVYSFRRRISLAVSYSLCALCTRFPFVLDTSSFLSRRHPLPVEVDGDKVELFVSATGTASSVASTLLVLEPSLICGPNSTRTLKKVATTGDGKHTYKVGGVHQDLQL